MIASAGWHGHDISVADETKFTPELITLLVLSGLLEPVARTTDGKVTEYRLTHAGRVLVAKGVPK